jgi:hypothetical protein
MTLERGDVSLFPCVEGDLPSQDTMKNNDIMRAKNRFMVIPSG